jgi:ArsR family transcriptional regulator, lead/cadmium/zinc/bismuth-responsive transcriptional repressor
MCNNRIMKTVPLNAKHDKACKPNGHPALAPLLVDESAVDQAARLFRALGDTARLRLAARLAQSEGCVGELAAVEGEAMSTISQRLRVLRSENIVICTREGKHRTYTLADRHVIELVNEALAHSSETKEGRNERRQQQNHAQSGIDRRARRRA